MKYICTRSFQFRGTMVKRGTTLDVSPAEASNPFVSAHTSPLVEKKEEAKIEPTPAAIIGNDDVAKLTDGQIKSRLAKIGVHYTNKMSREELVELYHKAQEALAGSPSEPNAPKIK